MHTKVNWTSKCECLPEVLEGKNILFMSADGNCHVLRNVLEHRNGIVWWNDVPTEDIIHWTYFD